MMKYPRISKTFCANTTILICLLIFFSLFVIFLPFVSTPCLIIFDIREIPIRWQGISICNTIFIPENRSYYFTYLISILILIFDRRNRNKKKKSYSYILIFCTRFLHCIFLSVQFFFLQMFLRIILSNILSKVI